MGAVNTVLGPIEPERLGRTYVHEHFVFGYPGHEGDRTMWVDDDRAVLAKAAVVAETLRDHGVSTVVDLTPNDCGRDVRLLRRVSEEHGLAIVATTGFYDEHGGGAAYFRFRRIFADMVAELTELYVTELTDGVEGTGIRAGVIKVATGAGRITTYEHAAIEAAAAAQRATGAPIITHTSHGTMGPQQAEMLLDAGADPAKVVIGHMCERARSLDYQLAVLDQGVGVAFDRFGGNRMFNDVTDDDRMDMVVALHRRGLGNRLFLSHDSVNHWKGRDGSGFHALPGAEHWSIDRIGTHVLPGLRDRGLDDPDLDALLVDNVANLWRTP